MKTSAFLLYSCLILGGHIASADDCESYYDSVYTKDVGSVETERMCAERRVQEIYAVMKQNGQDKDENLSEKKDLTAFAVGEFEATVKLIARESAGEDVASDLCKRVVGANDRYFDLRFQLINKSRTPLDMFLEDKLQELTNFRRLNDHDGHPVGCMGIPRAETASYFDGPPPQTFIHKGPAAVLVTARSVSVRWISIIEALREMGALEKFFVDLQQLKTTDAQLDSALANGKQKGLLKPL